MRRIFLSALLIAITASAMAVPAKRGVWRTVKLADGSEVKVELRGDEYMKFWQAEDGRKFVKADGKDYFVKADMKALQERAMEQRLQNPLPYHTAATRVDIGGSHPDFIGSKKGLIILAEFTDVKFQPGHDTEYYEHVANDKNFTHKDGFVGSIRDYFLDQSDGKFDLTFDVLGPVQLNYNRAYYGAATSTGHDKNAKAMIQEAVRAIAVSNPNFSEYDWFNDNYVDQVFVIYAGRGEANGGPEESVWPHRGEVWPLISVGGKFVKVYACSNELQSDTQIDGIGAFCHEFSHCLGLADLYDTMYNGLYGMTEWDIMAGGNYLGQSFRPCAYSGYERNYCGWKEPVVLTSDTEVSNIKGISEGGDYYIVYNDAHKDEYYVLENRNRTGWDTDQKNSGLLITHIDFDRNIWANNIVNSIGTSNGIRNDHQRYTLFLADNNDSKSSISGDLYPYNKNNLLTNYSVPAAILYNKNETGEMYMSKPITDITRNDDGTVSFVFKNEVGKSNGEMPAGFVFRETFDYAFDTGGNDGVWSGNGVATGTFLADNEGWTSSYKYGADKCARFGTNTQRGNVTTPEFDINGDEEIYFLAAPWTGEASSVTISVADGNATLSETTFPLTAGKWTECRARLSGNGTVKIKFLSNKARFFLDEVYVATTEALAIEDATMDCYKNDNRIYTIDGRYAGKDVGLLRHGIYVINGKKFVK